MCKYLAGLFLIVLLSGCKKLTEVDTTGIVRDSITLAPLDGVKVSLYEDNDGAFMGNHLLQEATTDASGTFRFNFKYKEGPYKIFVFREGFQYSRIVTDKIFNKTLAFEYQEIEPLKHEQHLTFDMDPMSELSVEVKNVVPAQVSDQIQVDIGRAFSSEYPAYSRTLDGIADQKLDIGSVKADKFMLIKYSVRENNVWRHVADSILVERNKPNVYTLHY